MKDIFESSYALDVTVTDAAGSHATRAFIEPMDADTPEIPEITAAGIADGRRWRVILPPLVLSGTIMLTDESGTVYTLLRYEDIGNGHHVEAVARREEAAIC